MRNSRRPVITRADIPEEMFEDWKRRRSGDKPESFRSIAIDATEKLGKLVRDDNVSRWLDAAGVARPSAPSVPKKQAGDLAGIRSDPKPAGHPASWEALIALTPSLADANGQPPPYTGSRSIPYAFAK